MSADQTTQDTPDHDGFGDRPWRVGRKVGRTVYDAHDRLIGVMDTPLLARLVVLGVNALGDAPRCLACGLPAGPDEACDACRPMMEADASAGAGERHG